MPGQGGRSISHRFVGYRTPRRLCVQSPFEHSVLQTLVKPALSRDLCPRRGGVWPLKRTTVRRPSHQGRGPSFPSARTCRPPRWRRRGWRALVGVGVVDGDVQRLGGTLNGLGNRRDRHHDAKAKARGASTWARASSTFRTPSVMRASCRRSMSLRTSCSPSPDVAPVITYEHGRGNGMGTEFIRMTQLGCNGARRNSTLFPAEFPAVRTCRGTKIQAFLSSCACVVPYEDV
jgi:hypothetical protein